MSQSMMLQFKEDDIILQQGCTEKVMYKILTGSAAVYFNYGKPDEYLVGILSEQRCFGELGILCGKPSTYTVVAYEGVLVMRITMDTFDDFIKHNPQNAIDIMKNLANTVNTLSLNLNMLTDDISSIVSAKKDTPELKDITHLIRQYSAIDAGIKTMFSESV